MAVGADLEAFGTTGAEEPTTSRSRRPSPRPAPRSQTLDDATLGKWRDIARETAWKDSRATLRAARRALQMARGWREPRLRAGSRRASTAPALPTVRPGSLDRAIRAVNHFVMLSASSRSSPRPPWSSPTASSCATSSTSPTTGRTRPRLPHRRRRPSARRGRAGAARACRHRGGARSASAAREPLLAASSSTILICSPSALLGGADLRAPARGLGGQPALRTPSGGRRCGFPTG